MSPPISSADSVRLEDTVSLAEFIKEPCGTTITARIDAPGYPTEERVKLTANHGRLHVPSQERASAYKSKRALSQAHSEICSFIERKKTDGAGTSRKEELEGLEKYGALLQHILKDYERGYEDNTVWIQGGGLKEEGWEYATPDQIQA